jgi:Zn-dependent protease
MHRLKFEEFGMALVGLAGPLTNFLLAIIAALLLRFITVGWLDTFLLMNVAINLGLGIFNLIPFPPLDGSRVLYALAPEFIQNIMMQIERLGFAAIFFFILVIFPFISPVITNAQQTLLRFLVS